MRIACQLNWFCLALLLHSEVCKSTARSMLVTHLHPRELFLLPHPLLQHWTCHPASSGWTSGAAFQSPLHFSPCIRGLCGLQTPSLTFWTCVPLSFYLLSLHQGILLTLVIAMALQTAAVPPFPSKPSPPYTLCKKWCLPKPIMPVLKKTLLWKCLS